LHNTYVYLRNEFFQIVEQYNQHIHYCVLYLGEVFELNTSSLHLSHILPAVWVCFYLMLHFFVSVATCCYLGALQQHTIHVVVSSLFWFLLTLKKLGGSHSVPEWDSSCVLGPPHSSCLSQSVDIFRSVVKTHFYCITVVSVFMLGAFIKNKTMKSSF
jgi:hypothetical protein